MCKQLKWSLHLDNTCTIAKPINSYASYLLLTYSMESFKRKIWWLSKRIKFIKYGDRWPRYRRPRLHRSLVLPMGEGFIIFLLSKSNFFLWFLCSLSTGCQARNRRMCYCNALGTLKRNTETLHSMKIHLGQNGFHVKLNVPTLFRVLLPCEWSSQHTCSVF